MPNRTHSTTHSFCHSVRIPYPTAPGDTARTRTRKSSSKPAARSHARAREAPLREAAKRHAAGRSSRSEKREERYPERVACARPALPSKTGTR